MRKLKIFLLMSAFIISFSLFSLPNVKAQANDFSRFTKENVITLSNGLNIIVRQPPAYFNPLTASDEELAYYFYPKRPNDPTELEEWKKRVNFNWIMPKFRVGKFVNPNTGEELDIRFAKTTTSYNWAGYVLNTTVARVSGNWTVPTITATSENWPAFSSQWIGLGGDKNNDPLLQTGTFEMILNFESKTLLKT